MAKLKRLMPRESVSFARWRAFLREELPEPGLRIDVAFARFAQLYTSMKGAHMDEGRPLSQWGKPREG